MMKLKLDMSCHLLNMYDKFQIDISKHVEKCSENFADGRTERHCHGIIRRFFKRAYKKHSTGPMQYLWIVSPNLQLQAYLYLPFRLVWYNTVGNRAPHTDHVWRRPGRHNHPDMYTGIPRLLLYTGRHSEGCHHRLKSQHCLSRVTEVVEWDKNIYLWGTIW